MVFFSKKLQHSKRNDDSHLTKVQEFFILHLVARCEGLGQHPQETGGSLSNVQNSRVTFHWILIDSWRDPYNGFL